MTDRVGQQLGNYRLIHRLGEGGFAEVYLGEHVYLKTQAAVKVLLVRLAGDSLEDFLTEARTVAGLKHLLPLLLLPAHPNLLLLWS
ncbi:MAG: hypothetical protein ACJ797_15980 [Ktedonobacteraceae bacterium]